MAGVHRRDRGGARGGGRAGLSRPADKTGLPDAVGAFVPRSVPVASALIYLVVVLAVAALIYLLASVVFGRGEELEPLPPGATPTRLPASAIDASDVRSLRFQQVVRGYKASEVDWALERLATEIETLHGRVAVLERALEGTESQDPGQQGSGQPGSGQQGSGQRGSTGESRSGQ